MFYKHKFEAPGKPGTFIFVQTDEERAAAVLLLAALRKRWRPPKYFFHLRKGGHLAALQSHVRDRYFAVLDIEGFFGSITRNKICRALKKIGFDLADAQIVAHRSCVEVDGKRFLPFGYVQSPMLASIVLDQTALGAALGAVSTLGVHRSVFMDDIILSHPETSGPLDHAISSLQQAAGETHLSFSTAKFQNASEIVRVFNILLRNKDMKISADRFEVFAQRILQAGVGDAASGILGYVQQVNFGQHAELKELVQLPR